MENIKEFIDPLHLEDLNNPIHPSIFDVNEEYNMLIMRFPLIAKKLDALSIGFVFTRHDAYLYDKEQKVFQRLDDRFSTPYNLMNTVVDQMLRSFTDYQNTVEAMEELLYEDRSADDFMTNWLDLKRDITRVERILLRATATLQALIKHYKSEEGFPENHYEDLHEHMDRTMRAATLQLAKLDYLYSFYNTRTNEKMNRMIYLLTIISAIFLPLNLVVGFFGMNTSGLPFSQGTAGTLSAVSLMAALIFLTSVILFKWRRKVEKST